MPCQPSKEEYLRRKAKISNWIFQAKLEPFEPSLTKANGRIYRRFRVKQAEEILRAAQKLFGEKMAVAFSGGKDSLVALHLALKTLGPEVKVIYNNTGVEFPDTIEYLNSLSKQWNLKLLIAKPARPFFSALKESGWATHEDRWCCKIYKDAPANETMDANGIIAEITGTTRTESIYRRSLLPFKLPNKEPLILRIHPIYDWNQWEVWRYIETEKLPYNPLYDKGYQRIGCWCCPLNGPSHYRRLTKTHPKLFSFLCSVQPSHPYLSRIPSTGNPVIQTTNITETPLPS
jgi:phosphoadenosine phosphosulfate reductase